MGTDSEMAFAFSIVIDDCHENDGHQRDRCFGKSEFGTHRRASFADKTGIP